MQNSGVPGGSGPPATHSADVQPRVDIRPSWCPAGPDVHDCGLTRLTALAETSRRPGSCPPVRIRLSDPVPGASHGSMCLWGGGSPRDFEVWLLPWALQPGLPPQLARAGAGRAAGEGPYYGEPLLALPHRVPPSCGQGLEARLALWASAAAPLRGAQRGQGWARRCARPAASAREMGPSAAPGPWPRCSRVFLASVKWGSQGQRGAGGRL